MEGLQRWALVRVLTVVQPETELSSGRERIGRSAAEEEPSDQPDWNIHLKEAQPLCIPLTAAVMKKLNIQRSSSPLAAPPRLFDFLLRTYCALPFALFPYSPRCQTHLHSKSTWGSGTKQRRVKPCSNSPAFIQL
ncbi:hypothetical protein AOLI_G00148080 [Acnodon oligacanthus]